jgi:hypothetical protein
MINQKQPENVKYSIYLGNMITGDARCRLEIQSGIDMAKAAFNKMETFFIGKLDLQFKEEITPAFGAHSCVVLKFKYFRN